MKYSKNDAIIILLKYDFSQITEVYTMALDRNQVPAERKWRVEDIFENGN